MFTSPLNPSSAKNLCASLTAAQFSSHHITFCSCHYSYRNSCPVANYLLQGHVFVCEVIKGTMFKRPSTSLPLQPSANASTTQTQAVKDMF